MKNSNLTVSHSGGPSCPPHVIANPSPLFPELHIRPSVAIRSMTFNEIESVLLPWASQENWNIRRGDLLALYKQAPQGFLLLTVNQVPAASLFRIKHSDSYTFIGLYLVDAKFRGKGYGKYLWDNVLADIDTPVIGGHAVRSQLPNYQSEGFVPQDTQAFRVSLDVQSQRARSEALLSESSAVEIKPITPFDFNKLAEYDRPIFPFGRELVLKALLSQKDTIALTAWENGQIKGYGIMKKCVQNGFKIAPLYADNEETFNQLLLSFLSYVGPNEAVYVDSIGSKLKAFAIKEVIFSTVLIYRGEFKEALPESSVYGIFSMEAFPL